MITGDADPDARVNLTCDKGTVVVMNRLDNTVVDQLSNETYATSTTTQIAISTVTLEDYTAPLTGNASDYVTTFTCTTVGQAATFLKDTLAAIITDEPNPYSAGSSAKNYLGEAFIVLDSDATTGKVYADSKLAWHNEFAALNGVGSPTEVIKLNTLNGDRRMFMENIEFCAAPTMIGNSGGWWNTLFGTEVTATITGNSGSVRTISSTAHNLVAGNYVQVGTVSGAEHTSCAVSNVSANAFDITVPATKDYSGDAPSIPTSGTLYYRPAFDHRNSVHHGNCVVARHASFSEFHDLKFDRLWTGGLMVRYSSYCVDNDCQYLRLTSAHTDSPNLNGRLGYGRQNYGLAKKNLSFRPVGKGGRHLYTDSCPETNSAFSAANWYRHVGGPVDCEVIEGRSDGATGGPWDTHPGSNRTKFKRCTTKDANRGAHEGSYFGHAGQARGSNVSFEQCEQEGGSHGIRIIAEIRVVPQ